MSEVSDFDPREVFPDGVLMKAIRLASTRPVGLMRQADVAAAMGVARSRISQIENASHLTPATKDRFIEAVAAVMAQHPDWKVR